MLVAKINVEEDIIKWKYKTNKINIWLSPKIQNVE